MIKPIAFHLPQYHPFPENDQWWGKGFTEWTNVTKAKPLFKGHYQPHLPADLGFYDLRLEEARIAQAELAKAYGIHGFCFYHYWFTGKRLMERPLDDMIKTKTPNFPFMLCWANENWTRRWDGLDHEQLIRQDYSFEDDRNHIRFLCNQFFNDPRYIRVNGKPFFLIYRPSLFPDIKQTLLIFREEAIKQGIGDIYLGYVQNVFFKEKPGPYGFDCAVEFQPDFGDIPPPDKGSIIDNLKHNLGIKVSHYKTNTIVPYPRLVDRMINKQKNDENVFPGITPGWDNFARRQTTAAIFTDSTPKEYERWLTAIKKKYQDEDTFLFINAWNEWAEGNHLEPCLKWGRQYLEATKRVLADKQV
jgi:lipopolysaccharide biosynthesis protein